MINTWLVIELLHLRARKEPQGSNLNLLASHDGAAVTQCSVMPKPRGKTLLLIPEAFLYPLVTHICAHDLGELELGVDHGVRTLLESACCFSLYHGRNKHINLNFLILPA